MNAENQIEAPWSWVERAYLKVIHYNKHDKGGLLCGAQRTAVNQ